MSVEGAPDACAPCPTPPPLSAAPPLSRDFPCVSAYGSTVSRARRGDRTIEAWPPSFCVPSRLDLPVVICQRDAFEPRPPGGAEPTRDAHVGGHLPPGALSAGLACALRAPSEPGDKHISVEAHLYPRMLGAVGQAGHVARQIAGELTDADQAVAVRIRLAAQRLQHDLGERPVAPLGVVCPENLKLFINLTFFDSLLMLT
jgi:hypothetical protein